MARKPSVRYWESRGAYMCWVNGRQEVLAAGPDDSPGGPTYLAALKRFRELLELAHSDRAGAENPLRVVVERYLEWLQPRRAEATFIRRKSILNELCRTHGETRVSALTQAVVYDWMSAMGKPHEQKHRKNPVVWSASTQRLAVSVLLACLNWARKAGLIPSHQLAGIERPPSHSRGAEALLGSTPAERAANHQRILEVAPKSLRPFIEVLEATGCRPGELCMATAANFDARRGYLTFRAASRASKGEKLHKTAAKGKDRHIHLLGNALDIVRDLATRYPTGPLFRSGTYKRKTGERTKEGWTLPVVTRAFRRIRERTGIPALTAYSYRHTFATAWIEKGLSIDHLAKLLGNSPEMIRKHYDHLLGDSQELRDSLEAFRSAFRSERIDSPDAPRVFEPDDRETA